MKISEVAIRRPVFTSMIALSFLVLGGLGLSRLGIDLFPDVSLPMVSVTTIYPGAGPEDIEQQVSKPLEDAVAGIAGVKVLHSYSRENASIVFIQFSLGTNLDRVTQEVRERIAAVQRTLPQGVETPLVARFDVTAQPILVYAASGHLPSQRIRRLIEDRIKPELEQVDGVALVRVEGGRERELRVLLDQDKIDAYNLPVVAVYEALRRENLNLPSGHLRRGALEIGVRANAQLRSAEEARRLVIQQAVAARDGLGGDPRQPTRATGGAILLGDIAEVVDGFAEERVKVRLNGQEAVSLEVVKQSGTNTLAIVREVQARMRTLLPGMPPGFEMALIIDGSDLIADNAREVEVALIFGGAMAILVILLFLLDVRGTLISALALPTSICGTFAVMWAFGYTLNILTLTSMSLAIGLLIDDSVVIREAITHRLEQGEHPFDAARHGTAEVGLAVMATSFTICSVFLPVSFMQGIVGQFFRQFGITVAAAVLLSLFVALTLDPMLSARLSVRRTTSGHRFPPFRWLARLFSAVEGGYRRLLVGALRHKLLTIGLALASLGLTALVGSQLGLEFIPNLDRNEVIVNVEFPPGTSLEETAARCLPAERALEHLPDLAAVHVTLGANEQVRRARFRIKTVPREERRASLAELKEEMRTIFRQLPQATFAISDPPILEGTGDWPPIVMQIRGPDLNILRQHAERIASVMRQTPGCVDVDIKDAPGLPEIVIRVDRERAREQGLTASDIAIQTRLAMLGEVAGKLYTGGEEDVAIRVQLGEEFRRSPEQLADLRIYSATGPVRLGEVATLTETTVPAEIDRQGRQRGISVWAYTEGRALGDVVADLHRAFDPIRWGDGYHLVYEGMQKDMEESNQDFALALLLALTFLFMVLASQFESIIHPFTIVLSLSLAFLGAFVALWLRGSSISIAANIGLILLLGLSAKNGILLLDGALQRMRDHHLSAEAAMLQAGPRRLRPILMTSAAMVLGMLPTALAGGSMAEFRGPMAVVVIGGVISNTLLTLLILPVIFIGFERFSRFVRRIMQRIAPATVRGEE